MTSTHPYGQLKHTTKAKQYIGNNIVSTEPSTSSIYDEAETRDYSNIEVHGYIPDKTAKSSSSGAFIAGLIILTIALWLVFYL
jgi:hypothetical protein